MQTQKIKVADVVFREDLYPRIKHDPATVQKYAENLEVLPPIEVNQRYELADGWHRWTAHKKAGADDIDVIITPTQSDVELLALACRRNATHGLQMNDSDKRSMAIRLYASGTGLPKEEIAQVVSVTPRMVNSYLSDVDRQLRESRKEKIAAMWMACHTQDEIAAECSISVGNVNNEIGLCSDLEAFPKMNKVAAQFQDDFETPIYNIWTFAKKTNAVSHFGNSEQRIVDNLLYLYTEPFDIVFDPFAGGGSTIDVCKKRLRRYWVSDRKPIVERENEIRKLDIVKELPPLNKRWSEVTLTYLDPPYWRQAAGKYSQDGEDLANMPLAEFRKCLSDVVKRIASKQSRGVIALLIQPTQWNADEREFTDHISHLIQDVGDKLKLENRVSCPYSSEQCLPQMVNWAKEHKKLLVLSRELIIWKVGA